MYAMLMKKLNRQIRSWLDGEQENDRGLISGAKRNHYVCSAWNCSTQILVMVSSNDEVSPSWGKRDKDGMFL